MLQWIAFTILNLSAFGWMEALSMSQVIDFEREAFEKQNKYNKAKSPIKLKCSATNSSNRIDSTIK